MPTQNIVQFKQSGVKGQLDHKLNAERVITCVVSASQSGSVVPGQAMKFDTSTGNVPSVIQCATSDVVHGFIVFDPKKSSPVAGDFVQIALAVPGLIMWLSAGGTIAAGAEVEDIAAGGNVQTLASGKKRGLAIDPATTGQLLRVILLNSVSA